MCLKNIINLEHTVGIKGIDDLTSDDLNEILLNKVISEDEYKLPQYKLNLNKAIKLQV